MTWALYLYDANDIEIGYVVADPYDYEITHPDSDQDDWIFLGAELGGLGEPEFNVHQNIYDDGDIRIVSECGEYPDLDPKEHLKHVQESISQEFYEYAEVIDE